MGSITGKSSSAAIGTPIDGRAVALLSNGAYSVLLTSAGAGYGSWRDIDVTRWREDGTRDCWGQFCYVRDLTDKSYFSAGKQPAFRLENTYEHSFRGDRAEFRCCAGDIVVAWSVCVAPDSNAEVRLFDVTNQGTKPRDLELTSYAEICLNNRRADSAHPAFAKLFIETRFDAKTGALFARRRPRSPEDAPLWAVHVSALSTTALGPLEFETDRRRFLGRGRTTANPLALSDEAAQLSGTTGPVLDPIFCLRRRVRVPPGSTVRVAFTTGAADSAATAMAIAERYSSISEAENAFLQVGVALDQTSVDPDVTEGEIDVAYSLINNIVFANPSARPSGAVLAKPMSRTALTSRGIHSDPPIVVVTLEENSDGALLDEVLRAHRFISRRGLRFNLVLVDGRDAQACLELAAALAGPQAEFLGKPGGIHLVPAATLSEMETTTLAAAARVSLSSGNGSLGDQLKSGRRIAISHEASPIIRRASIQRFTEADTNLQHWNGFGGFSADGREYVIHVNGAKKQTPMPWCNVIANPEFGCLTSESGLGYTWAGNSQLNRLTPWSNDPISDPPGEVIYLRDEDSAEYWTPTPLPLGAGETATVRHGPGYSCYESDIGSLHQELTVHVSSKDPVKIIRLELRNGGDRPRRLTATYYVEWVLGSLREDAITHVLCEHDPRSGAIIARNAWEGWFSDKLAFAGANRPMRSATCSRSQFLGALGSITRPAWLADQTQEDDLHSPCDPCAALTVEVLIAPNESSQVVFVLGQGDSLDQVRALMGDYCRPRRAQDDLDIASRKWADILETIAVRTPDNRFDLMMNHWLLYQVLSCRVWARSAFYQSGGAYGFRDQLQDVMALVYAAPSETRLQILRASSRQFWEGDVQHWWHPPSGVGVRTRMTDDLYFLPLVAHHYVSTTGDASVLDEVVPYITSPVLNDDEHEAYGEPGVSEKVGTVYDHCLRALHHGFRLGRHGLPLMGTGDWNDGMNRVGSDGKGESVWNGWFFLTVLNAFSEIADERDDDVNASWCRESAEQLRMALEANAWDGGWYRRAYFDDGTPLGSSRNDECQIDAIPQAWAVISGVANEERASKAMSAVWDRLVRADDKLIQLFDPPFDKGKLQPGYIKGYVPGIRENGGQYTHAAAWVVLATALRGDGDRAFWLWNLINPITHGLSEEDVQRYMVEPYVVSADVYGAAPHTGRGGWTWYTGSAAWLYRVGLEALLGIRREGQHLSIDPCIPKSWPGYELDFRLGSATYRLKVDNAAGTGRGVRALVMDGRQFTGGKVPFVDDGRVHDVQVALG
ncbi:UNVERIFIED_ORG: cellobiose phosphorylase [Ensifer adhaerens]|uniref:GH36-type glycosyl hydrolase domain-containing protein n=1 Tax=Ensifer canadensis TaxID=555315 RepID=UPI000DE22AF9|nr:glycosyl transferase [Ensifer canadensis]MDP9633326.1 cellobiose phosphorylase [Ensifer adhaerens]NOV19527.1 glycosyl transferase [Ensifer canadensis]